jgi:hypothetical protein
MPDSTLAPNQVEAATAAQHSNAAPIAPVVPVAGSTPVVLSAANPTTTVNAPASSVAVTVPGVTGAVTFSLVATDNLGAESQPAYVQVNIQAPPVAKLAATPATVAEGGTIELSGAGSTSSGSIASYRFSLVQAAVPAS